MRRSVEAFVASRYLVSRKNLRFINIIGFISIGGIAIGVAALLVALSVFNGFSGVVTSMLVGFDPHLRLEKAGGMTGTEAARLQQVIQQHPAVKAYSSYVSGKAMLVTKGFNRVVYVRGVHERSVAGVSGLKEKLVLGELAFHDSASSAGIIIGLALADRLASIIGSAIIMISPYGLKTAFSSIGQPETMKFLVSGIFESSNKDYDANYAYISIAAAQSLFRMDDRVNGIEVRLHDIAQAETVKEELQRSLPVSVIISTWYDLHKTLYRVMNIERWSAYVLLTLIIVVALFNMLGSLTMGVIEKRRDIAILKSLGMPSRRIVRLFMYEGILIGVVGTILGIVIGLIVLHIQIRYQIFPLDTNIYIIPAIPVEIHWLDFVSIAVASLGLSGLAAYYPARRAAATLPADALRWE